MDWKEVFFQVFGGLGLFLMGMKFMSDGIQKAAGDGLRKTLSLLTINRYVAIFVGFFVTAIIQSSSATTVMVVGFVNAGMMTLVQAIGIILGANIGTTATGWLVVLPIVKYGLPIIGLGVLLRFVSKRMSLKYIGEILFGLGILFLGMTTMSEGFKPLRDDPGFISFFTLVSGSDYLHILLGVAIGTLTTVVVQSSSATIGIAIALASQGLLNFEGAASLVLGDNIGTTITALLASVGANYHAKRAAIAHTCFNVLGVIVILIFFYPFAHLVDSIVPGMPDLVDSNGGKPHIGTHIAMFHSMFNITNVVIFSFLIGFLAKVVTFIIPEPKEKEKKGAFRFTHIHYGLIDTPAIGIAESEKELVAMAERVKKNGVRVQAILSGERSTDDVIKKIEENENLIDEYRKMITSFLLSLSQKSLSESDSHIVGNYITAAANLEKFGDYLVNIAIQYRNFINSGLTLSAQGKSELTNLLARNMDYYERAVKALEGDIVDVNEFLKKAETEKKDIKKEIREIKFAHFNRLKEGTCKEEASLAFVEMLTNLDGMASQVHNIAEISSGHKFWS
ncbi:MAG TPA: Na/Pi cotransporter family protein [bacterium]|nr:Na/Pi cotransporter family protein [bacterium]